MPKLNHPWRQAPALGSVSVRRSNRFSYHLQSLPPEERQRIEAAERAYVAKAQDESGLYASIERDFAESMVGPREDTYRLERGGV